jgi:hypothetical protein
MLDFVRIASIRQALGQSFAQPKPTIHLPKYNKPTIAANVATSEIALDSSAI